VRDEYIAPRIRNLGTRLT